MSSRVSQQTSQELSHELLKTIQDISRLFSHCAQLPNKEQRATYLQFRTLELIHSQPLLSIGEVATSIHISKSSATQLVERLVQLEFVEKVMDKDDKRSVRLQLTELGKKERAQLATTIHKHCMFSLSHLSNSDLSQLLRINKKLLGRLRQSVLNLG